MSKVGFTTDCMKLERIISGKITTAYDAREFRGNVPIKISIRMKGLSNVSGIKNNSRKDGYREMLIKMRR